MRLRGEQPRARTFRRKTDAELWAKKVESDLGHGFYVPTTADRRRTLGALVDKFLTEQLPIRQQRADERNVRRNLQWWKENAGFVTLDKLTPQTIAGFRSQLLARRVGVGENAKPVTQATVNRYLAALSAVCKWAWKELHWISHGMRKRASELATDWLGPRTDFEIEASLRRDVDQERWTGLDRKLHAPVKEGMVRMAADADSVEDLRHRALLIGRLQHLQSMGLARQFEPGGWGLRQDAQIVLQRLGQRENADLEARASGAWPLHVEHREVA